jgi:hypothetical protein
MFWLRFAESDKSGNRIYRCPTFFKLRIFMTQVEMLEQNIAELDDDSFAKLREWFFEFDQVRWDKQLEIDSNAGKLDFLINAALAEHQAGKTRDPERDGVCTPSQRFRRGGKSDIAPEFKRLGRVE